MTRGLRDKVSASLEYFEARAFDEEDDRFLRGLRMGQWVAYTNVLAWMKENEGERGADTESEEAWGYRS